jgi:hypothetical protein
MTVWGLNAGVVDTVGIVARLSGARRDSSPILLLGISLLAMVASAPMTSAKAEIFDNVANQTQFDQAIAEAQGSPDPSSTIKLTGSFAITTALPAITGKSITVVTGANTLTLNSGTAFNVDGGASLTITGNVLGVGTANQKVLNKLGTGDLVINGVTASGISRIGLDGGHTLVNGGSEVTFGTSTGGTLAQLSLATDTDQVASLTISGAGTKLTATGSDPIALSNGSHSQSALTIEAGAVLSSTAGVAVHKLGSAGTATINVMGDGSRLETATFFSAGGTSYFNVTKGGAIDITGNTTLGGATTSIPSVGANVTAVVSGAGSRWDTSGTLAMFFGSLSILPQWRRCHSDDGKHFYQHQLHCYQLRPRRVRRRVGIARKRSQCGDAADRDPDHRQ